MFAGIAAGLAAGALWGLVFVAPRMVAEFGSVNLTAGRFIVYGVVAVAAMAAAGRRVRWPTGAQAWGALWLSVLGFTGYYLVLVLAIRDAGSEMPALIVGTIPVWVMLLGKPHSLRWAALLPGLVLTVAGIVLMAQQPSVIKRPVVEWSGEPTGAVTVGFNADAWNDRAPEGSNT